MNSSRFERGQLQFLASLINCSPKEIKYITQHAKSYYGKRIEPKTDKETGEVKTYADGTAKSRTIRPSYRRLKEIQRSIKINILAKQSLPKNVKGGVKGYSNTDNANPHKGKKYKLSTDLQEFFPSVTFKMIYSMFLRLGYTNHVAHWLTKLTSIEFELPQGARTSTHIANLVFLPTDYKLIELCNENNITYTRWIDDLTFSSQQDFSHLNPTIISMILESTFKINWRKTSYNVGGKSKSVSVTGIDVFHNYLSVPNKLIQKIKKGNIEGKDMSALQRYVDNIRKQNPNAKTKENQKKDIQNPK